VLAITRMRISGCIELKNQLQTGQPRSVIDKMVEKVELLLGASGGSLLYAGYHTIPTHRRRLRRILQNVSVGPPKISPSSQSDCCSNLARGTAALRVAVLTFRGGRPSDCKVDASLLVRFAQLCRPMPSTGTRKKYEVVHV
jgi:hypothetical protein